VDPSLQNDRSSVGSTLLSPNSDNKGPPAAAGDPASILAAALANRKTKVAASGTTPYTLQPLLRNTNVLQMMKTTGMIGIENEIAYEIVGRTGRTFMAWFSEILSGHAWNRVCL